eukprot:TRINITY_DN1229_c1_g1_i1.p1 TRINITY_DN1229_c1_g1~~TRINITY_DN1229_c1_g1_i1.p1  ORF type:complete len:509 (-),score=234.96 TRINITY_DN1229_c1_g1_i1:72-1598(-)
MPKLKKKNKDYSDDDDIDFNQPIDKNSDSNPNSNSSKKKNNNSKKKKKKQINKEEEQEEKEEKEEREEGRELISIESEEKSKDKTTKKTKLKRSKKSFEQLSATAEALSNKSKSNNSNQSNPSIPTKQIQEIENDSQSSSKSPSQSPSQSTSQSTSQSSSQSSSQSHPVSVTEQPKKLVKDFPLLPSSLQQISKVNITQSKLKPSFTTNNSKIINNNSNKIQSNKILVPIFETKAKTFAPNINSFNRKNVILKEEDNEQSNYTAIASNLQAPIIQRNSNFQRRSAILVGNAAVADTTQTNTLKGFTNPIIKKKTRKIKKKLKGLTETEDSPMSLPFEPEADDENQDQSTIEALMQLKKKRDIKQAVQLFIQPSGEFVEDRLFFIQLPTHLPIEPPKKVQENNNNSNNKNTQAILPDIDRQFSKNIDHIAEGTIGKLVFLKSGKVKLRIGNAMFDISPGTQCGFPQEVALLDYEAEEPKFCSIGNLSHSILVTPDFCSLIKNSTQSSKE